MTDPNWTEALTASGTAVTAVLTLALVVIAGLALKDWRKSLENQRADECVSAIRDLLGAIGRCLSLKKSKPMPHWDPEHAMWQAHTDMWAAWRRFDRAFFVACK